MSSGVLVVTIVAAVLFVAFGVQVTTRQLQRFPVDSRRPGLLVDVTKRTSFVVRPAELEQLTAIVAESLSSEAVARAKLWPLLAQLERDAPHSAARGRHAGPTQTRRRGRSRQLDQRLADLEEAWGLGPTQR
ncbi:MAG: hypothetical protein OEV40_09610 [Acidimicrobiia bacterium]|nr:hypothetical protein [Acidimicrobiia bacterium]